MDPNQNQPNQAPPYQPPAPTPPLQPEPSATPVTPSQPPAVEPMPSQPVEPFSPPVAPPAAPAEQSLAQPPLSDSVGPPLEAATGGAVVSPPTDPSQVVQQPIPTAQPFAPAAQPFDPNAPVAQNMPLPAEKKPINKIVKLVAGALIAIIVLAGGFFLLKATLLGGGGFKVADLVEDKTESMTFKYPGQWSKVTEGAGSYDAVYTPGGKDIDESNEGLFVASQSILTDYSKLEQAKKDELKAGFEEAFKDSSAIESETCEEISDFSFNEQAQPNYLDAFGIEATCTKKDTGVKYKMKMVFGFKYSEMQMTGIVVPEAKWNKSKAAIDDILNSFAPIE